MQMSSLATLPNLKLAWRRITTGGNHRSKRFFRQLYYAYELALDKNLRDLRTRLLALAWEPQHPDRIYLPKPSGLQRPLSLMYLEDQIVLQALANLVARRIEARRAPMLDPAYSAIFRRRPTASSSFATGGGPTMPLASPWTTTTVVDGSGSPISIWLPSTTRFPTSFSSGPHIRVCRTPTTFVS